MNYAKRIADVQKKLGELGLDAFVVATMDSPKADANNRNVHYLSGFGGSNGVVAVSKSDAVLVVDGRYIERAKGEASGVRVVESSSADRRVVDFTNYVGPALNALGMQASRVGFESTRISHWMAGEWSQKLTAEFVPVQGVVESLRQFKDADEIVALSDACKATCDVWAEVAPKIVAGRTEKQVALDFDSAHRAHGAVDTSFATIVASGPNAAAPHHRTSNRVIEAGDVVTVDFGGWYESGYASDLTRTIFAPGKEPDAKLIEVYKIVLGANVAARDALRVGMTWTEYDKVARDYIVARGYDEYFKHGLGHSLGLEAHDPFNYAEQTFGPGLVITDEPGIYIPGLGGVRIEDDLVLTERGVKNLTESAPYLEF